eukprot:917635-Pelagomonas_calceolata.AAC.3
MRHAVWIVAETLESLPRNAPAEEEALNRSGGNIEVAGVVAWEWTWERDSSAVVPQAEDKAEDISMLALLLLHFLCAQQTAEKGAARAAGVAGKTHVISGLMGGEGGPGAAGRGLIAEQAHLRCVQCMRTALKKEEPNDAGLAHTWITRHGAQSNLLAYDFQDSLEPLLFCGGGGTMHALQEDAGASTPLFSNQTDSESSQFV